MADPQQEQTTKKKRGARSESYKKLLLRLSPEDLALLNEFVKALADRNGTHTDRSEAIRYLIRNAGRTIGRDSLATASEGENTRKRKGNGRVPGQIW